MSASNIWGWLQKALAGGWFFKADEWMMLDSRIRTRTQHNSKQVKDYMGLLSSAKEHGDKSS